MADLIPSCETLVVCWRHEEPGTDADVVWNALLDRFGLDSRNSRRYTRGSDRLLARLQAHKLVQEQRDRYWLLHPRLESYQGAHRFGQYLQASSSCFFRSELRLNTDGPTLPVLDLMVQLVSEVRPRRVIALSLGASTDAAHEGGDVILCGQARFALHGEISGSDLNNRQFGTAWTPPAALNGLTFGPLQAPPLQPPSPHYVEISPWPQPRPYTPRSFAAPHAINTSPALTEHQFRVPTPGELDAEASAVDMDCASVAYACDSLGVPCHIVLGVAVPPVAQFTEDADGAIRRAWIGELRDAFGAAAAQNAAEIAFRLVNGATPASSPLQALHTASPSST